MRSKGISDRLIADTPIAVIDFETTGLTAGYDRAVEISVVRVEPGAEPVLLLDTLINPLRPVAATEIHGITDDDVRDAPSFAEIADDVREAIAGCVVAAYNVYFDMAFLDYELTSAGRPAAPPHVCLMYMRPLLGLGKRCSLIEACSCHQIPYEHAHATAYDSMASARLLACYLDAIRRHGIRTFAQLARLKDYKFLASFEREPCTPCEPKRAPGRRKSRSIKVTGPAARSVGVPIDRTKDDLHTYWETLKTTITDLTVTDAEMESLAALRARLALPDDQVRVLHARIFMNVLGRFAHDDRIDDRECQALHRVIECLRRAGWAPGE